MKSLKTSLLALLFLNTSVVLLAQTGRDLVVTSKGDTLRGTIKSIDNYSKSLSFKGLEQNGYKTYSANDISFARYKSENFKSVTIRSISEERIFLEVLAMGEINLYKGKNRYYLEKDAIVQTLTKKDTIINNVQKTDRSYIGHLTIMMLDRDIPIEKINATGFNEHDLSRLVMLYNLNGGSEKPSRSFEKESEPTFVVGAKGGSYSSTFKYTKGKYSGYTFDPRSGSLFGIYANIRLTNKLFIQPELFFVSKGGVYSTQSLNYGQELNFDYLIESSQIAINFRYNFLTGRFTPYVLGGFCFATSSSSRTYRRLIYENYATTLPKIGLVSEIGHRGAIGVNYKLSKAWQISLEGLWENTTIHTKDDDFYSKGLGILANIGYALGNSSK